MAENQSVKRARGVFSPFNIFIGILTELGGVALLVGLGLLISWLVKGL
ncbi:MAG: hypothetical protein HPY58_08295 [Firmicutes bacterium]|nr:hypothetical protein [Bacillota bacterium]